MPPPRLLVRHPFVDGVVPPALQDVVLEADLEAVFPDGHILKEAMHDDGLHNDGMSPLFLLLS